jgi:alpha-glucoside transport system substrate-binding protein
VRDPRARDVGRRTLLRGAALAPLAGLTGLTAGCGDLGRMTGLGEFVRVAVSWSANELAAFQRVLDRRGTRDTALIPLGDDIGSSLGASTTGRPDVVALPQPGLVTGNVDQLAPLPDEVWHDEYDRVWRPELPTGRHYALPFKIAHASVVWYRKSVFAAHGLTPPRTWPDWLELNESIIDRTGVAPLALGGADGWVLAGFFENLLLRHFAGAYEALLRPHDAGLWASADVRAAFRMAAEMWGRAGALSGGAARSLVLQYPDAVLEVFRFHRAAMVPVPAFAEAVIRQFAVPPDDVGVFTFPAGTPDAPLVMSGDLLVLTAPASAAATALLRDLSTPDAPVPWIRDTGGFIAANPDTDPRYYSPTMRMLADDLRDNDVRFGLSDQLGRLGGREGLQRVLQEMLRALADGTPAAEVAATAATAMVEVEGAS